MGIESSFDFVVDFLSEDLFLNIQFELRQDFPLLISLWLSRDINRLFFYILILKSLLFPFSKRLVSRVTSLKGNFLALTCDIFRR